jgi:hypothetical protein
MAAEQAGDAVTVTQSYQALEVKRANWVLGLEEDVYDSWMKLASEAGHADAGEFYRIAAMATFKFFLGAM